MSTPIAIQLNNICPCCGKVYQFVLTPEQLERFENRNKTGEYVQDFVKDPTIAEHLLSGMCVPCQDSFFNNNEE